jgi:hypothetical protein
MAGSLAAIPLLNDSDSGLHIKNNIINELVRRINSAGYQMTGLKYTSGTDSIIDGAQPETSMFDMGSGSGDLNLLPNELQQSTQLRIKIRGTYDNVSGSFAADIKVKLGADVLITKTLATLKNASDQHFEIEAMIMCKVTGASGEVFISGTATYGQGDDQPPYLVGLNDTSATVLDTTTALQLDVTLTPSSPGGGDRFVILSATVEKLNLVISES